MKLYSTGDKTQLVSLETAVMKSLPRDGGLYMPVSIPLLDNIGELLASSVTRSEMYTGVISALVGDTISARTVEEIVTCAFDFPVPLVMHTETIGTAELWHGPSMAFKDFGARFMAQLMSYYRRGADRKTTILVATSGDTGGAVGAGFDGVDGVEVIILYPSGKVSPLQELQLTTLGDNVYAVEVAGTFDDCQRLVKQAFVDDSLAGSYDLSSANSINIARLIPQTLYYFDLVRALKGKGDVVCSVPSGNFGNLTAGVIAQLMGLPIKRFIAATNDNDIVPKYLLSGTYSPRPSVPTISNAMDVGSPSNFVRLLELHGSTWNNMKRNISGFKADDEATRDYMRELFSKYDYIADPHGAIGYGSLIGQLQPGEIGVYLETAHPAKFKTIVDTTLSIDSPVPSRLKQLASLVSTSVKMDTNYESFKEYLLSRV